MKDLNFIREQTDTSADQTSVFYSLRAIILFRLKNIKLFRGGGNFSTKLNLEFWIPTISVQPTITEFVTLYQISKYSNFYLCLFLHDLE